MNQHPNHPEHLAESKSIINSCVTNGFLAEDGDELVYITGEGKKFADMGGLIREWAIYSQPIRVLIGVGIVTLIADIVAIIIWIIRLFF